MGGGAGHATRSASIAYEIKRLDKSVEILFICSGIGAKFIKLANFRCEEIEDAISDMTIHSFRGDSYGYLKFIKKYPRSFNSVKKIINNFKPDIVVSDQEFASLLISKIKRIRNFLITHEIPPFELDCLGRFSNWFRIRGFHFALNISDKIIIPDIVGIEIPEKIKDKTNRVGFLAKIPEGERESKENRVLISLSFTSQNKIMSIFKEIESLPVEVWSRIKFPPADGFRYLEPAPFLTEYMKDCGVVICSGYSTVMEAVGMRVPCLIIPETREQQIFAKKAEKNGVAKVSRIESIREDILDLLDENKRKKMISSQEKIQNGSLQSAKIILSKS